MSDLISRQAAIDAIRTQAIHTPEALNDIGIAYYEGLHYAFQVISMLPSAEPEIIYCKYCEYWDEGKCNYYSVDEMNVEIHTNSDGFCSEAERRTDEGHNLQTGGY